MKFGDIKEALKEAEKNLAEDAQVVIVDEGANWTDEEWLKLLNSLKGNKRKRFPWLKVLAIFLFAFAIGVILFTLQGCTASAENGYQVDIVTAPDGAKCYVIHKEDSRHIAGNCK